MAKANKVVISLLLGILVTGGGLSGCSTPVAKTTPQKPATEQPAARINKQPDQGKKIAANTRSGGKDKHHIEYEKKRLRYNQQWLAQQEAKRQQQQKKYHEQYQARQQQQTIPHYGGTQQSYASVRQQSPQLSRRKVDLAARLSNAAINRTRLNIRYDGRYIPIAYPMGDVPPNIGVCTDVIIRSYRSLGIDLQRLVHEDMSKAFYAYPNLSKWKLGAPIPILIIAECII